MGALRRSCQVFYSLSAEPMVTARARVMTISAQTAGLRFWLSETGTYLPRNSYPHFGPQSRSLNRDESDKLEACAAPMTLFSRKCYQLALLNQEQDGSLRGK